MTTKRKLLKVEETLNSLVSACQERDESDESSSAYALLVDIESKAHDMIKKVYREINNLK